MQTYKFVIHAIFQGNLQANLLHRPQKMIFPQATACIVSIYWRSFGLDRNEWNVPELNELIERSYKTCAGLKSCDSEIDEESRGLQETHL